jgi:hypothetical protein
MWVRPDDPRTEGRADDVQSWLFPLLSLLILVGVVGAVILIIKYAVKKGVQEAQSSQKPGIPNLKSNPKPSGFPIITRIPEYSPPTDGPGRYRVQGVDRNTKSDITRDIPADTLANAKVKAELDGIIVTSVDKI